jgi:hypothetical protein
MGKAKRVRTNGSDGDIFHLRGSIELQLLNAANGQPVGERIKVNTVMTGGRRWVMEKIVSSTNATNAINAIAVGTSTATLNSSNTNLGSEITASAGRKTIGTVDATNITSTAPSWAASVLFATNEANNTIGEVGLFNTSSATAGTMLARATFTTFDKQNTNTLAVTYTISN